MSPLARDRMTRMRLALALSALGVAAAALPSSAQERPPEGQPALPAQATEYGVRPGDRVIIEFYTGSGERLATVAGTRIVDRGGDIFLPYIGTVSVAGLEAGGIRDLLRTRYESFYANPVVDVSTELRVNITGVVGSPGNYFLDPSATIIDALSVAGGASSEGSIGGGATADVSSVRLVRDGRTYVVDLRPGNATQEIIGLRIQSGDWIYVPAQLRSRIREQIQFFGSLATLVGTGVFIVSLLTR